VFEIIQSCYRPDDVGICDVFDPAAQITRVGSLYLAREMPWRQGSFDVLGVSKSVYPNGTDRV
jgi:hypothetical protein